MYTKHETAATVELIATDKEAVKGLKVKTGWTVGLKATLDLKGKLYRVHRNGKRIIVN